jgi:hypothetical protein
MSKAADLLDVSLPLREARGKNARDSASTHVLASEADGEVEFQYMDAGAAKTAARFWAGKSAYSLPKAQAIAAIQRAMKDKARCREIFETLPENQKAVLSIFKRYGGGLLGEVLECEVRTRGLAREVQYGEAGHRFTRWEEPVGLMRQRLLLMRSGRSRYSGYGGNLRYSDLAAHRGILSLAEDAGPWTWKAHRQAASPPRVTHLRRPSEVALDLGRIARELGAMGSWKTNRGGSLAQSALNRLRKAASLPCVEEALRPPECESLFYEILRGLGAVQADDGAGSTDLAVVERHLSLPAAEQARLWVRAWLQTRLWQDGIGVVPDRDNDHDPVRIPPAELRASREVLVWALCAVAHAPSHWLDLETFLKELWEMTGDEAINFYWHGYSWMPALKMAEEKDKFDRGPNRSLAFWLEQEGLWAANATLATLAHLGLVERGRDDSGRNARYCFRLAPLGRAVFGTPELRYEEPNVDPKFLKVLPNHEVLAYLETAKPAKLWTLGRMAERRPSAGGPVETFRLTREAVYNALESGMTHQDIHDFLSEHSQNGLPENVAHSLGAWAGKRESLVLRTGLALLAAGNGSLSSEVRGRRIGDRFVLLDRAAGKGALRATTGCMRIDYGKSTPACWRVEENGILRVTEESDSIAAARLRRIAERAGDAWRISSPSVAKAAREGFTAERIEGWLLEHQAVPIPAILTATIRNWAGRGQTAFTGDLAMLQVTNPETCEAILNSSQFRGLLAGHIPPDWFVIKTGLRAELDNLLAATGFHQAGSYRLGDLSVDDPSPAPDSPERRRRPGPALLVRILAEKPSAKAGR